MSLSETGLRGRRRALKLRAALWSRGLVTCWAGDASESLGGALGVTARGGGEGGSGPEGRLPPATAAATAMLLVVGLGEAVRAPLVEEEGLPGRRKLRAAWRRLVEKPEEVVEAETEAVGVMRRMARMAPRMVRGLTKVVCAALADFMYRRTALESKAKLSM